MRFREWSRNRWLSFVGNSAYPKSELARKLGHKVTYRYIDTAEGNRYRNTIADRCELVGGIVLSADTLNWVGRDRVLVVVGDGPTATIARLVALARQIPVVHIRITGTPPLSPLTDCHTRWLSPYFYDSLVGFECDAAWRWEVPQGFANTKDEALAVLECFSYGHSSGADVAARWKSNADELSYDCDDILHSGDIDSDRLKKGKMAALDWRIRELLLHSSFPSLEVGLVLNCRFLDREHTTLIKRKKPSYTSVPYWEPGTQSAWADGPGPIAIHGAGDGGLQDFLRATWRWERLDDSARKHLALFRDGQWPESLSGLARHLETRFVELRSAWGELDDQRLSIRANPSINQHRAKKALERKRRLWEREFHQVIDDAVIEAEQACFRWDEIEHRLNPRDAYLFTESSTFGPCFLHNHFFTRLTLRLQETSGSSRHLHGPSAFKLIYSGRAPCDRTDPKACARALAAEHFAISGIPKIKAILIRHGPARDWLINSRSSKHKRKRR